MSNCNAEEFYNAIAEKYDWFFSSWDKVSERQMTELIPLFKAHDVKTILDCSCGTGLQSIGLAKEGFQVIGSDISKGMIAQASTNATKLGANLAFVQSDFRCLEGVFDKSFDSIICMGNSLPHLMSVEDIKTALSSMYYRLNNHGLLIIEMRDYDFLLLEKPRFWTMRVNAKHDNKLVTILYVLDYLESKIRFNVVYIIQDINSGNSRTEVQSVDYNPIRREQLISWLYEVGFGKVHYQVKSGNVEFTAIKL